MTGNVFKRSATAERVFVSSLAILAVLGWSLESFALEPSASGAAATSSTHTPAASGTAATSAGRAPAASGSAATTAGATPAKSNSGTPSIATIAPKTPAERQAAQLSHEALGWDFKSGHFMVSEGKLREAIRICGPEVCSAAFQSRLHRDLGYLYVAGLMRYDDGRDEFTVAWSLDPTVALTPGMQTPEALQTFAEAKAGNKATTKPNQAQSEPAKPPPQAAPAETQEPVQSSSEKYATPLGEESVKLDVVPNWITISIQQDLVFHSKTQAACSAGSAYRCFNSDNRPIQLTPPTASQPGDYLPGGNQISGAGALPGTLRFLVGLDRVVHPHVSVGARIGTVVTGKAQTVKGDSTFLYFHGEARASVWIGHDVFSRSGVRPYVFLSAGIAEADGKILVDYKRSNDPNTYRVDAWKRSGHTFVSPGFGVQAAFTKRGGPIAEFRYMQYLSPNVPVLGFQLGYSFGF